MKCKDGRHDFEVVANGALCVCGAMRFERSEMLTPDGKKQLKVVPTSHSLKAVCDRACIMKYGRERAF